MSTTALATAPAISADTYAEATKLMALDAETGVIDLESLKDRCAISDADWQLLVSDPVFQDKVADQRIAIHKAGLLRSVAKELLPEAAQRLAGILNDPKVRADTALKAIQMIFDESGEAQKVATATSAAQEKFSVTINLGDSDEPQTVSIEAVVPASTPGDGAFSIGGMRTIGVEPAEVVEVEYPQVVAEERTETAASGEQPSITSNPFDDI